MKAVVVFVLLIATVFCHPVKRSASSSESSEEVVKPAPVIRKAPAQLALTAPTQSVTAGSDESSDSSDEAESSESAESEEATPAPSVEPTIDPTLPPITDNGRGDSMGYPDNKKSTYYAESNNVEKGPSPYKSYGKMEEGMNMISKMSVYNGKDGNDIEKHLKVYKALQVHKELLDEDTSTPEMESQGVDASSGTAEEPSNRQAPVASQESAEEAESASASDGTSESASASQESDSSQSSEEATATPGAADSQSDSSQSSESQESEEAEQTQDTVSEVPVVITAK